MNNTIIDNKEKNCNRKPVEKARPFRDVGWLIKTLREGEGFSKQQLADQVPCGISTLEQWEAGDVLPQNSKVIRLAEIFDTSPQNIAMGMSCLSTCENETAEQAELTQQALSEINPPPHWLAPDSEAEIEAARGTSYTGSDSASFSTDRMTGKGIQSLRIVKQCRVIELSPAEITELLLSVGFSVDDAAAVGGLE